MYLLNEFSRSTGQKKRRLKEYALNTTAGASLGGAIGSVLSAGKPSNIPKNIVRGLVAGSTAGAYKTYRTRKNRTKESNPVKKYINNKLYSNTNNLSEFKLLDKLPGRSDKGKKRKGVRGLIQTAKENPVEALALTAGGILATRYGSAGIKTALRASKKIKPDTYINKAKSLTTEGISKAKNSVTSGQQLNTRETLGKAINISDIPKSKVKGKKATAIASAFLKGSGSKARKDIRAVKKTVNYLKTGKTK